jgi:predicted alpha-1,2-mannosidase
MTTKPIVENQIKSEQRLVLGVKTGKWISKATMYSIDRRIGLAFILFFTTILSFAQQIDYTTFVDRFTGTGGSGGIVPVASMPLGMVQLGPDTRTSNTGYHYNDQTLLGFSHVHKSGAGCSDFQDILFLPLPANTNTNSISELKRKQFTAPLIHEAELAEPGYYQVKLYENQLKVELASSLRCGFQRYTYLGEGEKSLIIDLEHGSDCGCSIVKEQDVDTIIVSSFELVDNKTIRGMRVSGGFAPEQHVYFHTTFSQPIKKCVLFVNNHRIENITSAKGKNIKALLIFEGTPNIIEIKTGISPVDLEGAQKNHREDALKTFDEIRKDAHDQWNRILGMIKIDSRDEKKSRLFYTAMFNAMMYPMLYSDVDNRFRGPDRTIHKTDGYKYYGGVMGFWDTFRAACPLQSVLVPKVMEDYVKTCLDHFKYAGQLPIWTLAGVETYQMIGLPAMPFITNAYLNGINGFNTNYAMEAMRVSAMKDTCGYSMNYFVGLKNYKTYGYVPCNLEMESVARTLEYAYADRAIAEFAKATGHQKDFDYFFKRSLNYKNVIQPSTGFARGKTSDGKWREPFDPLLSEHRSDDYCEGNAWQWSFFVPHDVTGLANYMGGKNKMLVRMDSLFTMNSTVAGKQASGDISGLIGQYAQGNEPSHHIVYMYNELGEPKKTQRYVNQILTTLYDTTPEGICGNEDTGQMSAWYIFSSLGFYPMDPVSGKYQLGAPLFDKATIQLPSGKAFIIKANNLSESNIYVKKVTLNGQKLDRTYITFKELLYGGELVFDMTGKD